MDYKQLKIKSYKHWVVYLHENQCYIGRTFVLLKEKGYEEFEDFLAIDGGARDEFFLIGKKIKAALQSLFQPDKMNYADLSNVSEKIHVHFIPRYKDMREFAGVIFTDQHWGKTTLPYDRSFTLEESVLFQIRDVLKKHI